MTQPFEDLVRERTGSDFIERGWLVERIEQALASDNCRYVLVTGEPGAGKTSLLAGLADARPDWLRYFARWDSRTSLTGGDIQSFLFSIGHQLAAQRPEIFQEDRLTVVVDQHIDTVEPGGRVVGIRIEDLTASPFHRTAILALEQRASKVAGSVTAIEIGTANLEPRLLEPDNLAHLALIDPAKALLATDPDARIVILIDALDELAGERASMLDWLLRGAELPRNVRLVLASRPHAALEPLRTIRAAQLHEVAIDPASRQVTEDLAAYAEHALGTEALTRAALAGGHDPERLRGDAVHRAAGNFLYLATYARALADAAEPDGDQALLARLLASADLPPGLGGLYAFFMAIAHSELVRLGMLAARDQAGGQTPAWEGVGQPVLGVLTVAREPLTVKELTALGGIRAWPGEVDKVLVRLHWLLEQRDDRWAFYHASIGEFLASNEKSPYTVDATEWHERIVQHYRGPAANWAAVDWSTVDRYGLVHLAEHALRCRAAIADEAVDLVCGGLRRAIRTSLGSDRHFLRLLELVTERVIERFPVATGLPATLYLSVVRRQVLRGVRSLAPNVLGLLARFDRTAEALEHLAALPPSFQQFEAAHEIRRHTDPDRPDLLELLVETALTVPVSEIQRLGDGQNPLKRAAQALAPRDLDRALRLWERANEIDRDRHGIQPPDPVYCAAAEATSDVGTARELIASIHNNRAGAYLDLATRAGPAEAGELLRLAEASLSDASLVDQLRGRARLAVAWAPVDPTVAAAHIAALRAADRGAAKPEELTNGIVAAAAELAGHDRATTEALLDRLDAAELNGLVDTAFLRAATLWVEFGELDRARTLFDRVITWSNSVWTIVRGSRVVTRFEPTHALWMIEQAYARIGPHDPDQGMLTRIRRESELHTVAVELARYDTPRAVAVANELPETSWSAFDKDRYSTLAEIAHDRFDSGDPEAARTILAEILRSSELAVSLVDRRPGPYRLATGAARSERPPSPYEQAEHLPYLYNHTRDWGFLSERRFYRDPADVIRAMAPGSWSTGNPYCLARTVRTFAESIVDSDFPEAAALVHSITDGGERAIGLAALFRSADAARADQLWAEFNRALAGIPAYEWMVDDQDGYAFAYVRPDHRALFESAIRLIPHEADTGMRLLAGTGYLHHAFLMSFATYASAAYARSVRAGTPVYSLFQNVHESEFTRPPSPQDADLLASITRARVAFHEYVMAPQRRRAAALRIEDPLYAVVVELLTPTGVGSAFTDRVRALLPTERLPAVAGLVAFAAELWPDDDQIRHLAAEILAASEGRQAQRVVTLLQLASSPVLGELVDPEELLAEAQRLPDDPFTRVEQDEALTRLFPILLNRCPPVALRVLHQSVLDNWNRAMAQLEHAAKPLVATLGPDIVHRLTNAIRQALACVSPDNIPPLEIDGVQFANAAT